MGWFWADAPAAVALSTTELVAPHPLPSQKGASPPAGCPMHKRTIDVLSSAAPSSPKSSGCPVPHNGSGSPLPPSSCPVPHDQRTPAESSSSVLSKLNPLNYMFHNISQSRAPNQTFALPLEREPSTIPKGDTSGENWEYPSPQQMYNALLRKGYTDTDVTAVESMVAVHNFLNEGAWAEIVEWERRFGRGLSRGWKACSRGEEHSAETVKLLELSEGSAVEPKLVRFQGRPKDMTPKAAVVQAMGKVWPSKFGTEPPFDRHDWYVARDFNGTTKQVRYVIDYYSGPPEPTGEPVFYLDVRPAMTPSGAAERLVRWGSDVWWRASGGEVREKGPQQ